MTVFAVSIRGFTSGRAQAFESQRYASSTNRSNRSDKRRKNRSQTAGKPLANGALLPRPAETDAALLERLVHLAEIQERRRGDAAAHAGRRDRERHRRRTRGVGH